jgi:NitT/TauT family transport system substrate-binding protein
MLSCGKQPEKPGARPEAITLAYAAIPHASLAHIAFAKGYFADAGLNVNPQPHGFGKLALESVVQGQADVATAAETPVMFAILNGGKICIAASIETSDRNLAIIARKDMGIGIPRDIQGKTIGVAMGSNGEFFLDAFLVAQGIDRSEINATNMAPSQIMEGLLTGKIAAAAIWNPILTLARKALGENSAIYYGEELYTENFCIAVSQDFAEKRPEALKRVLKALIRAEEFAKRQPEEAINLVAEFIKTDQAALQDVWDDFRFKVTLDQSLLMTLEDESRWAIKNRLVPAREMPNYLDFIHTAALSSVNPQSVRIIR